MKIRVSEVFGPTIQGEGKYTGSLSIWVRFFGCNLNCSGFHQKDPTAPETYILPLNNVDFSKIKKMEDLPVFSYGCDSGYSWSEKFKHLAHDFDEFSLSEKIKSLLPNGLWVHENTGNSFDLCFTGGEPMMWQKAIIKVVDSLEFTSSNQPIRIQIETNGTKEISEDFRAFIVSMKSKGITVIFNISPKLFNVSGEPTSLAWKPKVIQGYVESVGPGEATAKFVMNGSDAAWEELDSMISDLKGLGISLESYIMPVGATKEQQEDSAVISKICDSAIARGFHVSGRLHCNIWGNVVGV